MLSFTRNGTELNQRLCKKLKESGKKCRGYSTGRYAAGEVLPVPESFKDVIGTNWGKCGFVFIGACGIAVRYIAPWMKDKFTDSPVAVVDEKGEFAIPLLSGHAGGAVELSDEIAGLLNCRAVHTTATDVNRKFAVDLFAGKNHLLITDRKLAKEISAAILDDEKVGFCVYPDLGGSEIEISGRFPEELHQCRTLSELGEFQYSILVWNTAEAYAKGIPMQQKDSDAQNGKRLLLLPVNITVGIGCRRGISYEELEGQLKGLFEKNGLDIRCAAALASIDLKKDEHALHALAEAYGLPYVTYPAEELKKVTEVTSHSEFVAQVTGVDNVCERAAKLYCPDGVMIQGKWKGRQMTAALLAGKLALDFDMQEKKSRIDTCCSADVLIFGGTTEGRLLAEYAQKEKIPCFVSTATEYGGMILEETNTVRVLTGHMDEQEIFRFVLENKIRFVIDATHPFAVQATKNIRQACTRAKVQYTRCLRDKGCEEDMKVTGDQAHSVVRKNSLSEAVQFLQGTSGNILITTGSNELEIYQRIKGWKERCFARVLSTGKSVEKAVGLGFEGKHLIAMQGPFSKEMNIALLRQTNASYMVTKESGSNGGFEEKADAAAQAGAVLVVIGRPRECGVDLETVKMQLLKYRR